VKAVATDPPTFELNEWEPAVVLPGVQLGERDRLLAAALAERESRLIVDEVRAGVRVRPTSWVGVIRFEDFEVRVVPKLVGGNLGVIEMIDYASGLGALARFSAVRRLSVASTGRLVDLLGLLLAESSERLVRDGLLQDYVAHEEALPVVRGRLLAAEQVQRHFGRIDRLECRFDELETDILENRLVTVGLALARRVCGDPEVRRRLARVHGVFDDACTTIGLEPAAIIGDVTYQRRNSHYRTAHAYARYFIERLGVADLFAPGGGRSFAFLLDMNVLFERFVTRFLEDTFAGSSVRVMAQRRDRSLILNEATWRPYAAVIPDVLLERDDGGIRRRVPVDAKYKLYDERKLEPADVYQVFFYAYAYARQPPIDPNRTSAFIVYPASSIGGGGARLRVQGHDGVAAARLRAIPFDIQGALSAIHDRQTSTYPALEPLRAAVQPAVTSGALHAG
jgi:5-methylcytosine-specific restriction enzyme subunit McrC